MFTNDVGDNFFKPEEDALPLPSASGFSYAPQKPKTPHTSPQKKTGIRNNNENLNSSNIPSDQKLKYQGSITPSYDSKKPKTPNSSPLQPRESKTPQKPVTKNPIVKKLFFEDAIEAPYSIKSNKLFLVSDELLTEFLCATLYEKILHEQAPNIEIVPPIETPRSQRGSLQVKFKADFSPRLSNIRNDFSTLENLTGFSKVVAACLFLGEKEPSPNNMGIAETNRDFTAVKTDHSHSAQFAYTEDELRSRLICMPSGCHLLELKAYLEEMIKLSDDEIVDLVLTQAQKLKDFLQETVSTLDNTQQGSISPHHDFNKLNIRQTAAKIIKGIIWHKDLIKDDFIKTLEIIEIIGQGAPGWNEGDWVASCFEPHSRQEKSIETLIWEALQATSDPFDLNRLKEIAEHFHNYHYDLEPSIEILNKLEACGDWKSLNEFEKSPDFLAIKRAQKLKKLIQRLQAKQDGILVEELDLEEYRLEREKMKWLIENLPMEAFNLRIPSYQAKIRDELLLENETLFERYKINIKRGRLLQTLKFDIDTSIRILFEPTDDLSIQDDKRVMLQLLIENPLLREKYYPLQKFENYPQSPSEIEKNHLLNFMKRFPCETARLLESDNLEERYRDQMEAIMRAPRRVREEIIAVGVKKIQLSTASLQDLIIVYQTPGIDSVTKKAIFSLHKKQDVIQKITLQQWKQWAENATPKEVFDRTEKVRNISEEREPTDLEILYLIEEQDKNTYDLILQKEDEHLNSLLRVAEFKKVLELYQSTNTQLYIKEAIFLMYQQEHAIKTATLAEWKGWAIRAIDEEVAHRMKHMPCHAREAILNLIKLEDIYIYNIIKYKDKKAQFGKLALPDLIKIYEMPDTDPIDKEAIFSVCKQDATIQDLTLQQWKKWATDATPEEVHNRLECLIEKSILDLINQAKDRNTNMLISQKNQAYDLCLLRRSFGMP